MECNAVSKKYRPIMKVINTDCDQLGQKKKKKKKERAHKKCLIQQ